MPDLQSQLGELKFTLEIVRGDTGLKETVEMVGIVQHEEPLPVIEGVPE